MLWSPHFATRAYVETLELRRSLLEKQRPSWSTRPRIVEPAGAEVLSALAAGIHAQHIVQVGCGLSTIALASAAKTTGSCLISLHTQAENQKIVKQHLQSYGLHDYVQFLCGDIRDIVSRRRDIDFVFIGGDADLYIELFDLLDLKPGAIVVADYALDDSTNDYIRHVRRQPGVESSTLPVGRGLEITKVVKWEDFKNGRQRYVRSPSPGPPRQAEDSHSSKHSESAGSLHSNPNSVSSVLAAEAWMASKAATFLTHTGNSDETTYSYAAQELALSVNSSISSVHAAEAWMAAQVVKAFYINNRDDDDEYYELEPQRHDATEATDHVNGNASDFDEGHTTYDGACISPGQKWHGRDDLVIPKNGFASGQADYESDTSYPPDGTHRAEVRLLKRTTYNKVETDNCIKHKSTLQLLNTTTGESEFVRCEDSDDTSTILCEGYSDSESANGVVSGIPGSRQGVEPRNGTTKSLLVSEETHRLSQGRSEYDGVPLTESVTEQKLSSEAIHTGEQDPKFEITFQDDDGQTAVTIQGVDQDMLLFDITMAFKEAGVSVRRAKIATLEEYIDDIFYVVDSKTGAALDISSWDRVKGTLLSKILKL